MNKFVPRKLADFLPDEEMDDFGYIWRKEQKQHTLEFVGYDADKAIGAIVLDHDGSKEANERVDELSWVRDRANIAFPEGITLNDMREVIRRQYDLYG